MPDLVIRHIDSLMAERIKTLAKDRHWSINDVVLHALRHGLGLSAAGQISSDTGRALIQAMKAVMLASAICSCDGSQSIGFEGISAAVPEVDMGGRFPFLISVLAQGPRRAGGEQTMAKPPPGARQACV